LKSKALIIYKTEKMKQEKKTPFLTVTQFDQIPFLVHGFGMAKWKETEFKKRREWKDFKLIFLKQIHSDIIHFIDRVPDTKFKGDALLTRLPFLFLIIKTADCLPVLIVDKMQHVIAAVHCGWRGTKKRVLGKVLQGLETHYGCRPESLHVALGPCIGPRCYEVGGDVRQSFEEEGFPEDLFQSHPLRNGKYIFDLRKANLFQIQSRGVKKENIFVLDICSHCEKSFPSFRRDGKKAGRMLSFIGMSF